MALKHIISGRLGHMRRCGIEDADEAEALGFEIAEYAKDDAFLLFRSLSEALHYAGFNREAENLIEVWSRENRHICQRLRWKKRRESIKD